MNIETFRRWVRESREQQRRAPERYLAFYPELVMTERLVVMTQETFDRIERDCGRYEGTLPTGEYLGKMFLRGDHLYWIGIDKERPFTHVRWNSRRVVISDAA